MQAATAAGIFIPYFCWHPQLSVPGNCRICVVEVEAEGGGVDRDRLQHARGRRHARAHQLRRRAQAAQGDAAVHHAQPPGRLRHLRQGRRVHAAGLPLRLQRRARLSSDAKLHATKYYELSPRIVLDNERCILCSRCVRFTREISKSNGLGIKNRGDHSLVRAIEDGSFEADPYSDNVIDICPVGALLSRSFLHKARVWYLKARHSVCPGCARGCTVNIWHRKPEWKLRSPEQRARTANRPRHAAGEPCRQRPVDLQQGPRPGHSSSSVRAPSARCSRASPRRCTAPSPRRAR